jgi:hypothetical protein
MNLADIAEDFEPGFNVVTAIGTIAVPDRMKGSALM